MDTFSQWCLELKLSEKKKYFPQHGRRLDFSQGGKEGGGAIKDKFSYAITIFFCKLLDRSLMRIRKLRLRYTALHHCVLGKIGRQLNSGVIQSYWTCVPRTT